MNSDNKSHQAKGVEIDWDYVNKALDNLMTSKQICDALKINPKTLSNQIKRRFRMTFEQYRDHRRAETFQKILVSQLKLAVGYSYETSVQKVKTRKNSKGQEEIISSEKIVKRNFVPPDPKMLIHLGQQYLSQRPVLPKPEEGPLTPASFIIEDENGNIIPDQTDTDADIPTDTTQE